MEYRERSTVEDVKRCVCSSGCAGRGNTNGSTIDDAEKWSSVHQGVSYQGLLASTTPASLQREAALPHHAVQLNYRGDKGEAVSPGLIGRWPHRSISCYTRAFGDGPRHFEPLSSDMDDGVEHLFS
ncbi:hypothetical protein TNCV_4883721 [Trichonephila clavipes]|nr:hypothetical protein TNCV_4883721 [Trichonephila clavipes]